DGHARFITGALESKNNHARQCTTVHETDLEFRWLDKDPQQLNCQRKAMLEKLFKLQEHGTSPRTEIVAGLTTFLTMSYIIFVSPDILSSTGMDRDAVFGASCLAAAIGTLIMTFVANWPIA